MAVSTSALVLKIHIWGEKGYRWESNFCTFSWFLVHGTNWVIRTTYLSTGV